MYLADFFSPSAPNTDLVVRDTDDSPNRQTAIDGFVALNALLAMLVVHDEKRFYYPLYALWTFRSALEYPVKPCPTAIREHFRLMQEPLEVFVPAAAKLIEIAGHKIVRWDHEYEYGPLVGDAGGGGDLWDGTHGFCRERWAFWRRRFGELGGEVGLGEGVRECASRAEEAMARIDE